MSSILASPLNRAGVFFALGFLIATGVGSILGTARVGIETGLLVGAAAAIFAVLFVRPTETTEKEG
ncbi:hypothetical protein [Natronomonas sp. EA1]|uniref:hypothetical protein n=1 Tax=Natronomonas sp. EA1 TaxID=3421655 RepID=UPI003EBE9302